MSRLGALLMALSILQALGASAAVADARADCFAKSGDAAIRACTEAIAQNPRDAVSYINRAYEYLQKADHTRSFADYTRAIEIDLGALGRPPGPCVGASEVGPARPGPRRRGSRT